MTIANILNVIGCGLAEAYGTGTKGCEAFFKKVSAIWLFKEGFKLDSSQTLNQAYINQLQAEGNLIVLKGVKTFSDNSEEDVIETLEDGTKQVARLGLYEFAVQFINGLYFQKALTSLNSFGAYDVAFVDVENNILGTTASDGSFKGFTVGMLQGSKLSFATDAVGQKQGLALQLLERSEVDTDHIFISHKNLGSFRPKKSRWCK